MNLRPITQREAFAFVKAHHRHHKPPQGWVFGVAAEEEGQLLGVAIVGRPVARRLQDGFTCEVTRCCIVEGLPLVNGHPLNVASKLYSAAWRAAKALGYRKMLTYTLQEETGASLAAAGWEPSEVKSRGGSWGRDSRPRTDAHPLQPKRRFEAP